MRSEVELTAHELVNTLELFLVAALGRTCLCLGTILLVSAKEASQSPKDTGSHTFFILVQFDRRIGGLTLRASASFAINNDPRDAALLIVDYHEVVVELLAVIVVHGEVLVSAIARGRLAFLEIQNGQYLVALERIVTAVDLADLLVQAAEHREA